MKAGLRGIQVQPVTRGPRREKRNRGQKRSSARFGMLSFRPGVASHLRREIGKTSPGKAQKHRAVE
jgi:hypothetical protein